MWSIRIQASNGTTCSRFGSSPYLPQVPTYPKVADATRATDLATANRTAAHVDHRLLQIILSSSALPLYSPSLENAQRRAG